VPAASLATILLASVPMHDCADAARLSPDERISEVAAVLATGLLRLHERSALLPAKNPAEVPPDGLEVPAETRLSVRVG
jgi:hypothetical protein